MQDAAPSESCAWPDASSTRFLVGPDTSQSDAGTGLAAEDLASVDSSYRPQSRRTQADRPAQQTRLESYLAPKKKRHMQKSTCNTAQPHYLTLQPHNGPDTPSETCNRRVWPADHDRHLHKFLIAPGRPFQPQVMHHTLAALTGALLADSVSSNVCMFVGCLPCCRRRRFLQTELRRRPRAR